MSLTKINTGVFMVTSLAGAILRELLFNTCQQLTLICRGRLESPAQILCQELLRRSIERHAVYGPGKTVSFVREYIVLDRLVVLAHGGHDLVTFRLVYTRIVGSLPNQQRGLNLVRLKQW